MTEYIIKDIKYVLEYYNIKYLVFNQKYGIEYYIEDKYNLENQSLIKLL